MHTLLLPKKRLLDREEHLGTINNVLTGRCGRQTAEGADYGPFWYSYQLR